MKSPMKNPIIGSMLRGLLFMACILGILTSLSLLFNDDFYVQELLSAIIIGGLSLWVIGDQLGGK